MCCVADWLDKCEVKIYALLTKREVKMAGYWPSSFSACLWTETKSRSINTQKRTRPIFSHLDRTSLVNKGFNIDQHLFACLWTKRQSKSVITPNKKRASKNIDHCTCALYMYNHFIKTLHRKLIPCQIESVYVLV